LALKSLKREDTEKLLGKLLKDQGISIDDESFKTLVGLSDSHPFNVYRMMEEISDRGVAAFIASPKDYIDWKHRQSSDSVKSNSIVASVTYLLCSSSCRNSTSPRSLMRWALTRRQ
jgi:hypothetical protein